jgi:hypothetical protein
MKKSSQYPDNRSFVKKHKILTAILILFGIGIVGSALSGEDETPVTPASPVVAAPAPTASTPKPAPATPAPTTPAPTPELPKEKTYGTGMYMVGTDIQPGLYRVVLQDTIMKMGYVERAKDVSMKFEDIIANIVITGDGYVAIKETDKVVKVTGAELTQVDYKSLPEAFKDEVSDGIYLVNKDLKPGTYKVIVTDSVMKMGYVERAKNVSMGFDDIIANDVFQGDGYVKISKSDYAIRVQGATLIFQP